MSSPPPEMRETRPLLDTPASVGGFIQPATGEVAEATERTALLTKKEYDHESGIKETIRKDVHFRNIDARNFWALFGTIIFGNIIVFFDGTLMASAHPVITSYFHSSNSASWLSTVFFLTLTVSQPLYGRVSDTIGRRPVYLFAEALFLISTVWCALAPNMGQFIAARAISGMGAGGVACVSNMITSDVVKIEYRGIYQSYYNLAYALGNGFGAAFGGMLCDSLGWRWAFGIQVPFIAVFFIVTYCVTPTTLGPCLAAREGKTVWQAFDSFDFSGSAVVTITVTSLILGINLGGNVLSWTHPFVIVCLVLTIIGGCTIAPVSRRAKRPVLPLHLLAKSPNSNLMWASMFFSICLNIVLFNVPLFLQAVRQTTPTVSGLYLVVPLLGVGITSMFTGYFIARTRHMQPQLYLGQFLLICGVLGTTCLSPSLPTWALLLLVPWVNIGQGFYFPTTTIATLSLNTLDDQAVVVSTLGLFRCIGAILGVAVSSWILQNTLPFYLERIVSDPNPDVKEKIVQAVRASVHAIKDLDPVHRGQVVSAYAKAMRVTFASGLIFAVLVVVLSWPVRLPRLRSEDDGVDTDSEGDADDSGLGSDLSDVDDEEEACAGGSSLSRFHHGSQQGNDEEEERSLAQGFEDSVGLSRETTRLSRVPTGTRSRRQSELRLSRETSRQALQLGRKASVQFDTLF